MKNKKKMKIPLATGVILISGAALIQPNNLQAMASMPNAGINGTHVSSVDVSKVDNQFQGLPMAFQNTGFEANATPSGSWRAVPETDPNVKWKTTDASGTIEMLNNYQTLRAHSGGNFAELNSVNSAALYQDITGNFVPGQRIDFTFYQAARNTLGKTESLKFTAGKPGVDNNANETTSIVSANAYTSANYSVSQSGVWIERKGSFIVPNDVTDTLRIGFYVTTLPATGLPASEGNLLDDVSFAVPSAPVFSNTVEVIKDASDNTSGTEVVSDRKNAKVKTVITRVVDANDSEWTGQSLELELPIGTPAPTGASVKYDDGTTTNLTVNTINESTGKYELTGFNETKMFNTAEVTFDMSTTGQIDSNLVFTNYVFSAPLGYTNPEYNVWGYDEYSIQNQYVVSYDNNGGTGTTPTTSYINAGEKTTMPVSNITRSNSTFIGWNTSGSYLDPLFDYDNTNINSDINLKAVWKLDSVTINPISSTSTTVTGTGIPGSLVEIKDEFGNVVSSTTIDTNGTYSMLAFAGPSGTKLYFVQTDPENNVSDPLQIVVGGSEQPIVNPINSGDNVVTGTGTPNSVINVYDDKNNLIGSTTVSIDGTYSVAIPVNTSGKAITVKQSDGANNTSQPINVIVGATENPPLISNPVLPTDTKIIGVGTPGATVEVKNASGTVIGTTIVKADGSYEVPLNQAPEGIISITQNDNAGNESTAVKVAVGATATVPTTNKVDNNQDIITGTGTPGATIQVKDKEGNIIGTSIVDSEGNYSVSINPLQSNGDLISIVQGDGTGNFSAPTNIIVGSASINPTVDSISPLAENITGTGTPGAIIEVRNENGDIIGTSVVDQLGNYNVAIPSLTSGSKITVVQNDGAGNLSSGTNIVVGATNTAPKVNAINPGDNILSGTGTPGANIVITDIDGNVIGNTVVKSDGSYDVIIPELAIGSKVNVIQNDGAGNESPASEIIVGVTSSVPVVNPVNPEDNSITGTGIPGAKVEIKDQDGKVIGTGIVGTDGTYNVVIPSTPAGTELSVTLDDGAGNTSASVGIIVGATSSAPVVNVVNPNDSILTGTGTPGASVVIRDAQGNIIGQEIVAADGTYSVTIPMMPAGSQLTVSLDDGAGNISPSTSVIVGATSIAPVVNPVNPSDASVSGTGIPGSSVLIKDQLGNIIGEGVVGVDGTYNVSIPPMQAGAELNVVLDDGAGNLSPSTKVIVGATSSAPVVNAVKPDDSVVTGTGVPGANVVIKDQSGNIIGSGVVDAEGKYSVGIPLMPAGSGLKVTLDDGAGNTSQSTDIIVGATSTAPTVNPINPNDTSVTGTGIPGAKVIIKDDQGNVVGEGIVGNDGTYNVVIPLMSAGSNLVVLLDDGAGNVSPSVEVLVGATSSAPVVNTVNPNDSMITGLGTPGANIEVKDVNGNVIGNGIVANDGTYNIAIPTMPLGSVLSVTSNDGAGNYSPSTNVIVGATTVSPTVNVVNPNDTVVTGTGLPGANVVITDQLGNVIGNGIVSEDGTYSVAIPKTSSGTELNVTLNDGAGNSSTSAKIIVGATAVAPTVNPISPTDSTITGTGTPGANVVVKDQLGNIIGNTVVGVDGMYSVVIPPMSAGSSLIITQDDGAGNVSPAAEVIVGATTTMPKINAVNTGTDFVSGTGVPGALILVKDVNGEVIGSTIVAEDGSYNVNVPVIKAGDVIYVSQGDGVGNESSTQKIVAGATAFKPSVDVIEPGAVIVTGTGTPGAIVEVIDNSGNVIGSSLVMADGTYKVDVSTMNAGDKISVVQKDEAGNLSPAMNLIVGAASLKPTINPIAPGATNVSGTGIPGAIITVKDDLGNVLGNVVVEDNGEYSVTIPATSSGSKLIVTQDDGAGNVSPSSQIIVGGASTAPTVNEVQAGANFVTGTGTPGSTIIIRDDKNNVIGSGVVANDGTYNVQLNDNYSNGTISIVQEDGAGNVSPIQKTIIGIASSLPVVNAVNPGDSTLSGTGLVGAQVTINDGNGNVVATTVVDENGLFSVEIPKAMQGDTFSIIQSDLSGNMSAVVDVVVGSTSQKPIVNPINANDTNISGVGLPGSIMMVYDENGVVVGVTKVGADGKFSVPLTNTVNGAILSVVQTDGAGNKGEMIEMVVGATSLKPVLNAIDTDGIVSGTGIPNSIVNVYDSNGEIMGSSVVLSDGTFKVALDNYKVGMKVTVKFSDNSGNESAGQDVVIGAGTNNSLTIDPINSTNTVVSGTGTPNAMISVYDQDGKLYGTAIVDVDGRYEIFLGNIPSGTILSVTQSDLAGHESSKLSTIVDALKTPVINPIQKGDSIITGTGTPGTEVFAYDQDGNLLGSSIVNQDGTYSINLSGILSNMVITIVQQNVDGTRSEAVVFEVPGDEVVVEELNAMPTVEVNKQNNNDTNTLVKTGYKTFELLLFGMISIIISLISLITRRKK